MSCCAWSRDSSTGAEKLARAREARRARTAAGGGVARAGIACGAYAEELDVDAAVSLQALHQAAVRALLGAHASAGRAGDGLGAAAARGMDAARVGARLQIILDGLRPLLGEALVGLRIADAVGVADDLDLVERRALQAIGELIELRLAGILERRLAEIEQHVGRQGDFLIRRLSGHRRWRRCWRGRLHDRRGLELRLRNQRLHRSDHLRRGCRLRYGVAG